MQRKDSRPRPARAVERTAPDAIAASTEPRTPELTTSNKILVAALGLDREQDTFTAEDLIVASFKSFPESFGLNGYRDRYPDSNRVLAKLMGATGLCARGWLEQLTTKTYRLTPPGRKLAATLRTSVPSNDAPAVARPVAVVAAAVVAPKPAPEPAAAPVVVLPVARPAPVARAPKPVAAPKAAPEPERPVIETMSFATTSESLDEQTRTLLLRLVRSSANQKFSRGGIVTYTDACMLWGVGAHSTAAALTARLGELEQVLDQASQLIQHSGAGISLDESTVVTLTTVVGLQGMHRMLLQKYRRELDSLRARHD